VTGDAPATEGGGPPSGRDGRTAVGPGRPGVADVWQARPVPASADFRLRLRPLTEADEPDALAAQEELAVDGFDFLLGGWQPQRPWAEHLAILERERTGVELPGDRVPATFLVAEVDGRLVGRVSIRHRLNDWLAAYVGHIGYGVRPTFRRRGHATEILRQSLVLARDLVDGDRVLMTCGDDNAGSAAVIERCGGVFEGIAFDPAEQVDKRRYWIALDRPHRVCPCS
jgi:predicted acetyltransferase